MTLKPGDTFNLKLNFYLSTTKKIKVNTKTIALLASVVVNNYLETIKKKNG